MDTRALEAVTGWRVHHLEAVGSTNDVAVRLRGEGGRDRTAVVADRQTAGRGREGRRFASPAGGLYVSLLVRLPEGAWPATPVALAAVAAAEAVETVGGVHASIKWPNDLWLGDRKVGGILLETAGNASAGSAASGASSSRLRDRLVVIGIGINLRAVPAELPVALRETLGALDTEAGRCVERGALLEALLGAVDRWMESAADAAGHDALEAAWRQRLALVGEPVTCTFAGGHLTGTLEDVSLTQGLLIRDPLSGPVWRAAEHVQDLRPA